MADNEYDHCPREQRLRVAGQLLIEAERAIAAECAGLLLNLEDPLELKAGDNFLRSRWSAAFRARKPDLARRAARAAMAVLLADDDIELPEHIEVAYNMPEAPLVELQRLIEEQRALVEQLKAAQPPSVRRLIALAAKAHEELARADTPNAATIALTSELGAAIQEAV